MKERRNGRYGGRLSRTRVMKGRVWEGEREGSRWAEGEAQYGGEGGKGGE